MSARTASSSSPPSAMMRGPCWLTAMPKASTLLPALSNSASSTKMWKGARCWPWGTKLGFIPFFRSITFHSVLSRAAILGS